MRVGWHLDDCHLMLDFAYDAPQRKETAVHGHPASQVRQTRGLGAITTELVADQCGEGSVLGDRQDLPVTGCPSAGRVIPGEHSNFSNEGIHGSSRCQGK
jgi:hypothetical protein